MKPDLYWIDGPWRGRLAVLGRPRGGEWLEDELRSIAAEGVDVVICALTSDEKSRLGLDREEELVASLGLEYLSFPIPDRGLPQSFEATAEFLHTVERRLNQARVAAVHCRAGIGRSAVLVAALLALAGASPLDALARIAQVRGCEVPDTVEQRQWLIEFAGRLAVAR